MSDCQGKATGGGGGATGFVEPLTGSVLQTKYTHYTDKVSLTNDATGGDVANFEVKITPRSATSQIMVSVSVAFGFANDSYPYVRLIRVVGGVGTSIGLGTGATGSQINVFLAGTGTNIAAATPYRFHQASKDFLDSPATTTEVTYKIQFVCPYGTGYINRQAGTDNNVYIQFPSSHIQVQEIAGASVGTLSNTITNVIAPLSLIGSNLLCAPGSAYGSWTSSTLTTITTLPNPMSGWSEYLTPVGITKSGSNFSVTTSGIYMVNCTVRCACSAGIELSATIYKNSVQAQDPLVSSSNGNQSVAVNALLSLTPSDTVSLSVRQGAGGTTILVTTSSFIMYRLA
jgi:hypothetical protein